MLFCLEFWLYISTEIIYKSIDIKKKIVYFLDLVLRLEYNLSSYCLIATHLCKAFI